MGKSQERIIRQALDEGRAKGCDYLTQTQPAVEAGRQARPDLTASDILAAAERGDLTPKQRNECLARVDAMQVKARD